MSSPQEPPPKKEKKGLKKLWRRLKDALKGKPTKAATTSSSATAATSTTPEPVLAPSASEPAPASPPTIAPTPVPAPTIKPDGLRAEIPPLIEVDDNIEDIPLPEDITDVPPAKGPRVESALSGDPQMRFNKAQAIFAKYNLELSEADWDNRPKVPYERVAKNIRMRVRYTCHNCSTTFGHDRVCVGCQHQRCSKCARYPPKKDRSKATKKSSAPAVKPPTSDPSCHECQTGFRPDSEECPNCHHKICEKCLQEASVTIEHAADVASTQRTTTEPAAAVGS